jgi:hypothetical protein
MINQGGPKDGRQWFLKYFEISNAVVCIVIEL